MANDNKRAGSHEVLVALEALRRLGAPEERIRWSVAEQRWRWFIREVAVVTDNSEMVTRDQLIEVMWAMAHWLRYMAFHCPKLKGRAKEEAMDCWLDLCQPLERLDAMEQGNG